MICLRTKIVVLLSLFPLSGCGGMIASMSGVNYTSTPYDYADVTSRIVSKYDAHRAVTEVTGPVVYAQDNFFDDWYMLRSFLNDDGTAATQIYVSVRLGQWAFIDRAYSHGERLSLTEIDRDVVSCSGSAYSGCSLKEDVAINISKNELEIYSESGLTFKVYGDGGSASFVVPAEYFQAVYDTVYSQ